MKTVFVKENQSVFDIALQEYGNMGKAMEIVQENKLKGVLSNLPIGMKLFVNEKNGNKSTTEFLSHYNIQTLDQENRGQGIGFWAIGKDFKVT